MGTLFLVAILSLALFSLSRTQRIVQIPPPRPLCASQYVLANYACSRIPMFTFVPPSPIAPPSPLLPYHLDHDHDHHDDDDKDHNHDNNHNNDHDHDHNHDNHDHNHDNHDHDHNHENHDHDHNHDNHDHHDHNHDNHDDHHSEHHKRHHHHHHHYHRHKEAETYAQQECCKWLKQMDNVCVCELLVRLPQLLTRPAHGYTVFVDDSCIVTFTCEGRLIP